MNTSERSGIKVCASQRKVAQTPMASLFGLIGGRSEMPTLTRHRDPHIPQECWRVYLGDIDVGMTSQCVGNPGAEPKWQWRCGFYPGSRPASARMEQRKPRGRGGSGFEVARRILAPVCTLWTASKVYATATLIDAAVRCLPR